MVEARPQQAPHPETRGREAVRLRSESERYCRKPGNASVDDPLLPGTAPWPPWSCSDPQFSSNTGFYAINK